MSQVILYGFSDDLIEIEGAIEKEVYGDGDEPTWLAFSDGTLIRVTYDGDWHFKVKELGEDSFAIVKNPEPNTDQYTDTVTLNGDIRWVVVGTSFVED